METVVLPTPPTSGAIMSSNNYDRGYDNALAELITNNNVAETGREILAAIGSSTADVIANNGVHSVAALNATNLASVSNLKATGDASVAGINATSLNGVAGIKQTTDAAVAVSKNVTDGIVSVTKNVTDGTVSVTKAVTDSAFLASQSAAEGRLTTVINGAEIRELINSTAVTNLIATKDEGCKTREQEASHFAALSLQACENKNDLEKELLKGFHTTQLEAQKNACELAAKIAECCCEQKLLTIQQSNDTRTLILAESTKRCESENANLRMELLLRKCGGNSGNGNGNGNGNS